MPTEIIVLNLPRVIARLEQYPDIAGPESERATRAALLSIAAALADYPERAGSSYDRTGTLGREWTEATPEARAMGSGFEGEIGNNTGYAAFVQGEEQAWMHVDIWSTAQQIADDRRRSIIGYYGAASRRIEAAINAVTQ